METYCRLILCKLPTYFVFAVVHVNTHILNAYMTCYSSKTLAYCINDCNC